MSKMAPKTNLNNVIEILGIGLLRFSKNVKQDFLKTYF